MIKLDILGSCVTRDAFALVENDYIINSYHARTSIISIYSPPIYIKKEGIDLASKYQQRMVYFDFIKDFYHHMRSSKSEVLIIDFMDERLGVIETNGTYLTNSDELKQSKLKNLFSNNTLELDNNYLDLWRQKTLKFLIDLKKSSYKKIFIHKAFYLDMYLTKEGHLDFFTDPVRLDRIKARNEMLSQMYDFVENNMDNVTLIHPKGFSVDANHKWGLSPFHYEKDYYTCLIEQLNLSLNIPTQHAPDSI